MWCESLARMRSSPEWQVLGWWGRWRTMWREVVREYSVRDYPGDAGMPPSVRRFREEPLWYVLDDTGEPVACWDIPERALLEILHYGRRYSSRTDALRGHGPQDHADTHPRVVPSDE